MYDPAVTSIRLRNLSKLEIDVSFFENGSQRFTNIEVIDCPDLFEFWYRPFLDVKLPDDHTWSLPNLKKLKTYCSQKFMTSLNTLEMLIICTFESEDKSLLEQLPKLNFLDIHEINVELFSWIENKYGRKVRVSYRGLSGQYTRNRIQARKSIDRNEFWAFKETDLKIYQGLFERTNSEIHFYRKFYISDPFKKIERSFFRKFVDVKMLICNESALNQDEMLGILGSFLNVEQLTFKKRQFDRDFYERSVPLVCPHLGKMREIVGVDGQSFIVM